MKIARSAVQVIGSVATVLSFIPSPIQPIAAAVAAVAAVASAGLQMAAKKPSTARGSPTEYKLDPQAGIPYMMGRTFNAGNCVKRETWGEDNKYQGFTSIYSYGPINGIEAFTADRATINFGATGNAIGQLADFMWLRTQLGQCPELAALPSPVAGYPGWGAASKLSGLAASNWVIKFDKKGKKFTGGPPSPGIIGTGVKVYDPRLDDTYPGGSGPCRALDESTYVYSERPHLHALTWALGRYQNGKRRMGIGFAPGAIDINYFVEGANVDDANDWKVGGTIYSTDDKWNVLKQILEAGASEPVTLGGRLSVLQCAPKVSIATITSGDVMGRASVTATQTRRDRINGGVPRYRSEAHGWQVIPAAVVRVPEYVEMDGGQRTREHDWSLVQVLAQATQLTAYRICNGREIGPIELSLKLRWIGIAPGNCVTLNIPEANLISQKAIVISRTLDPATGAVTVQFKTETDAKHAFSLGQEGAAPPVPTLTAGDLSDVPAPPPGSWTLTAGQLTDAGGSVPILRFDGEVTNTAAEAVIFDYREFGTIAWQGSVVHDIEVETVDIGGQLAPGAQYEGGVRYVVRGVPGERLVLGPVSLGSLTGTPTPWPEVTDPDGTRPEDNATVGAPTGTPVGDRNAEDVTATIDSHTSTIGAHTIQIGDIITDVDDLYEIYGDTASAEASAAAAASSASAAAAAQAASETARNQSQAARDAAEAAEDNAISQASAAAGSASAASGSASSASGSATVAATHAGAASVSAGNAAVSESNAAGSASSAASSASISAAARDTAINTTGYQQFTTTLGLQGWATTVDGLTPLAAPATVLATAWEGGNWLFWPAGSGQLPLFSVQTYPIDPARKYRISARIGSYLSPPSAGTNTIYAGFVGLDGHGAVVDHGAYGSYRYAAAANVTQDDGDVETYSNIVTGTGNDSFYKFPPGTAKIRLLALLAYPSGSTLQSYVKFIKWEDVTESEAAGASATASATSASSAAASMSAAASHASAASSSATVASTKAAEATTSAGNASVSESNAAGSASVSASHATLSATARDSARLAAQSTLPDNFTDPANWVAWNGWGGGVTFSGGLANITLGGSFYSAGFMPVAAGQAYRITSRFRVINQGGGLTYLGVNLFDAAGAGLGTFWSSYAAIASPALDVWAVASPVITAADILAAHPTASKMVVAGLYGYANVSDAQVSQLRLDNITSETASGASASASATSASAASASQGAAAASASSASTSANTATVQAGNASTSASAASSSAAAASSNAASAATSATLSASINTGALNPNPMFGQWANASNAPDYWTTAYFTAPVSRARYTGANGIGYAIDVTVGAGGEHEESFFSGPATIGKGAFVLEFDIELVSGDWKGAGVRFGAYDASLAYLEGPAINCATDIPVGHTSALGYTPAAGRYFFRKIFNIASASASRYYLGISGGGLLEAKGASGRVILYRGGVRSATDAEALANSAIPSLQASVSSQSAAITTLQGRALAYWNQVVNAGIGNGATAFVELRAEASWGAGVSSTIAMGARELWLYSQVGSAFTKAMSVVSGNVTIYGDLNALGAMRFGTRRIAVALQSFNLTASDGDSVAFGGDLVNLPRVEFDLGNLPVLTGGQQYDIRALSLTPTGFTMYAKIITPGSPTTVTQGPGGSGYSTPSFRMHKSDAADSNTGYYTFAANVNVAVSGGPGELQEGMGSIDCYVRPNGGSWTYVGTLTQWALGGMGGSGTANVNIIGDVYYANAIGQDAGGDHEFGISPSDAGTAIVTFTSVEYTKASTSGSPSAVPQNVNVRIIPQNA